METVAIICITVMFIVGLLGVAYVLTHVEWDDDLNGIDNEASED